MILGNIFNILTVLHLTISAIVSNTAIATRAPVSTTSGQSSPTTVSPIGANLLGERNLNASFPGNSWRISMVENDRPYAIRIRAVRDTNNDRHHSTGNVTTSKVEVFTPKWTPSFTVYYYRSSGGNYFGPDECVDVVPSDACFLPTDGRCHDQTYIQANDFELRYSISSDHHDVITEAPNITVTYEYTECRLKRPWLPIQVSPIAGIGRLNTTITSNYWNISLLKDGQPYSVHFKVSQKSNLRDYSVDCTSLLLHYKPKRYEITCYSGISQYIDRHLCLDARSSSEECNQPSQWQCASPKPDGDHFEIWYNLYGNENNLTVKETDVSVTYEYRKCEETRQPTDINPVGKSHLGERRLNTSVSSNHWRMSLVNDSQEYSVRLRITHTLDQDIQDDASHCTPIYLRIDQPTHHILYCGSLANNFLGRDHCVDVLPSSGCHPPDGICDEVRNNADAFDLMYNLYANDNDVGIEGSDVIITYEYTNCQDPHERRPTTTITTTTISANYSTKFFVWILGATIAVCIVLLVGLVGYFLMRRWTVSKRSPARLVENTEDSEIAQDEPSDHPNGQNQGRDNLGMEMHENDANGVNLKRETACI